MPARIVALDVVVGEGGAHARPRDLRELAVVVAPRFPRGPVDVGEPGVEHRRVVGVQRDGDAGVAEHRERVLRDARVHPRRHVGHGRDLERDPRLGEVCDERRIVHGAHAVSDPVREVVLERLPHVARSRPLARVGDRAEAGILRPAEQRTEGRDGGALAAGGVQRDDAPTGELQRHLQRSLGQLESRVTHQIGGEAGRDAEVAPTGLEAVQHGFDRPEPVVAEAGRVVARREDHLGVADAGAGLVLAELVGEPPEVLDAPEQRAHRRVLPDEIVEPREPPSTVDQSGGNGRARPLRELAHGRDPHRALEVDVQLRLRKGREVAHPRMLAGEDAVVRETRSQRVAYTCTSATPHAGSDANCGPPPSISRRYQHVPIALFAEMKRVFVRGWWWR